MSLPTEHMPQDQVARTCRVLLSIAGRQREALQVGDYPELERLLEQRAGLLRRLQSAGLGDAQREQVSLVARRLQQEDADSVAKLEDGLNEVRRQVQGLTNQRRVTRAYGAGGVSGATARHLDARA